MTLAAVFDAATLELGGTSLVEASAGTGKTHAITLLVVRLILERELSPAEVLVMTFTEAATAELRVRVRRRLQHAFEILRGEPGELGETDPDLSSVCARVGAPGLDRVKRALADLDEAPITTIHGFCHRVLHDHALSTGAPYGAELAKDLEELDEDVVYDFWHREIAESAGRELVDALPKEPLKRLRNILREVRRHARATLVPEPIDEVMALDRDFVRFATEELKKRKERQGVFGFDDLLGRVAEALRGPGAESLASGLRERFKAVLLDEFQDTDPVQWEIVEKVFVRGKLPLFLIGDPKQAIYGFRGADVFTYLAAGRGARRSTMRINWRSDPGLVAAVNQLFCPPGTFVFPEIEHGAVAPRPGVEDSFFAPEASGSASLELLLVKRDEKAGEATKASLTHQAPRITAAEIARLLATETRLLGRRVVAADIAVLTRSNAQCFLVQDALRELGINSVVISDESVWRSEEAQDLERVLDGVLDPGSSSARKGALATTLIGQTAGDIDRLDDEPERLEHWLEHFQRWQGLWAERGFLRMLRQLMRDVEAEPRLLSQQGGERRLTNLLHVGELLERSAAERELGPAALLDWLAEQRRDNANRAEHTEIRLESDADAVRILTIHKSKGLEFPVVFCPFLWGGTFPFNSVGKPQLFHENERALLDVDTDKERRKPHIEIAKRESVAEEIRLAYVALTRAQHRCTILWSAVRGQSASAFGFVWRGDASKLWNKELTNTRGDGPSDADLTSAFTIMAETSGGAIGFRAVPWRPSAEPLPRVQGDAKRLQARRVERPVRACERTESFSGLTRNAHDREVELAEGTADAEEQARDHDETLEVAGAGSLGHEPAAPAADEPIVLSDFPRGPRAGNFFHEIYETIDFATATGEDILEVASQKFESFGFAREFPPEQADRLLGQAVNAVVDSLETPLGAAGFRLADVARERRFSELEFRIPVAQEGARAAVSVERLARAFREHPSDAVPKSYAERLERLRFGALRGFLKGYIDLVFMHEGLWYVVDYKTNHLGDFVAEYGDARMQREMADSHYYLQYHLYSLAVDRFLRRVEPGYDYERRFGGVFYLFVKGMKPGKKRGVFFEKPPLARLSALSTLFDGASP